MSFEGSTKEIKNENSENTQTMTSAQLREAFLKGKRIHHTIQDLRDKLINDLYDTDMKDYDTTEIELLKKILDTKTINFDATRTIQHLPYPYQESKNTFIITTLIISILSVICAIITIVFILI